jgi:hypothetical protein
MKSIKHTLVALSLIVAASVTANAQTVALGLYNTSTSLAINLGNLNQLTANEQFNLGNAIETTLGTSGITFDIAGAGSQISAVGGFAKNQIALTITSLAPTYTGFTASTPITDISGFTGGESTNSVTLGSSTSSTGVAITAFSEANGPTSSSFNHYYVAGTAGNTPFGLGAGLGTGGDAFPTSGGLYTFYTLTRSGGAPTVYGTFQFSTDGSGNDILTYDPTSTPEPSAYALGLCALALFAVLNRRRSTV